MRIVQRWRPAFLPRACESQGMNPTSNERKVALPFRTVTGAGESSTGLHPPSLWVVGLGSAVLLQPNFSGTRVRQGGWHRPQRITTTAATAGCPGTEGR